MAQVPKAQVAQNSPERHKSADALAVSHWSRMLSFINFLDQFCYYIWEVKSVCNLTDRAIVGLLSDI